VTTDQEETSMPMIQDTGDAAGMAGGGPPYPRPEPPKPLPPMNPWGDPVTRP
jgi:hypothetical protein